MMRQTCLFPRPPCKELSGLEVKLKVHSEDSDWLAAQEGSSDVFMKVGQTK